MEQSTTESSHSDVPTDLGTNPTLQDLLTRLQTSAAFQATLNVSTPTVPAPAPALVPTLTFEDAAADTTTVGPPEAMDADDPASVPSASVSALLARLRGSADTSRPTPLVPSTRAAVSPLEAVPYGSPGPPKAPIEVIDVDADTPPTKTKTTFQEVLPRLASMGADRAFVDELINMKREQQDTENKLWMERLELVKKQEAKVKAKRTEALMVGSPDGLTPHDASQLKAAFARELRDFDVRRVLPAIDGLRERQRAKLGQMGVPGVGVGDEELEGKVMQVLEGLVGA